MTLSRLLQPADPPAFWRPDGDQFEVTSSRAEHDDEWDQFVCRTPGAHHEQTSRWACVKRNEGWDAIRLIYREQEQIVGGAQLLFHQVRPFGIVGYVPYGPCLANTSRELIELSIRTLLQIARHAGVWYLVVSLPDAGHSLVPHFTTAGFWQKPAVLPPKTLMAATVLLDLSQEEQEILARMRRSTRYNIRQGLRGCVRIRDGQEADLDVLFNLMLATCRRRGESPSPGNKEFFHWVWREFHPAGWVRLSIAECQGEPICAECALSFSDTYRLWKFGWSGKHRELNASDVLRWDSITRAKRMGFRQLDFVQIDPEIAAAIASGAQLPSEMQNRRLYGATFNKLGFGGRITTLPGEYAYCLHPILRHAYSAFGARLLKHAGFVRMLGRVTGRAWGRSART